jgi:hypothetical protein
MSRLSEEIGCVLCKASFVPVVQPEEGKTFNAICCSSCTSKVPVKAGDPVRVVLRDVLGFKGLDLAMALEGVLATCPCGGAFAHDAGKRCPACIRKIDDETKTTQRNIPSIWDVEKLNKLEDRIFPYILEKLETKEETLAQLIDKFESGVIDTETYMDSIENIRLREFTQVCAIQTWAMIQGPEGAFRAAEDLELVERYGTRILISIATALEMSTGLSIFSTLNKEIEHLEDPVVQKELKMFMSKTTGR